MAMTILLTRCFNGFTNSMALVYCTVVEHQDAAMSRGGFIEREQHRQ
jgi:hypothetical protein